LNRENEFAYYPEVKKLAAFLLTFLASALLVSEIRLVRTMQCFGCTNVKCVIRTVDEHPQLLITDPGAVISGIQSVPYWWD